MTNPEFKRLKLLTLSKRRVNLADSGDWQQLASLETEWNQLFTSCIEDIGDELIEISPQLTQDIDFVLSKLEEGQKKVLQARSENEKRTKELKKYLA